ncbi:MAG TPA: hypothetical protein VMS60_05245 [Solirubrobacterales bacterium]|nr:hypothetical protein [Solirubrobacterales bacterium]
MPPSAFHGLIQHSFALRLAKKHSPFVGSSIEARIGERFALPASGGAAFDLRSVRDRCPADAADHSPLVRNGRTTVQPLRISFSGADGGPPVPDLPSAFEWAGEGKGKIDQRQEGPTFVFAGADPETGKVECNDYLVEQSGCPAEAQSISSTLLEILAHKRSRLLGLALANQIVSVLLPHAVLTPADEGGRQTIDKSWFVQPLVSLIRDGGTKTEFRDSYSLTLLLIPITDSGYGKREMTRGEIDRTVNAGWGLATVPTREKPSRFQASGPLLDYLSRLTAPFDPTTLLRPPDAPGAGRCGGPLTLRQGTEVLAFGVGLRLAQGSLGGANERTVRRIGDDVVTALGSARVSSVLVVDKGLTEKDIVGEEKAPLKKHRALMAKISRETRRPPKRARSRKHRLDRAFVDDKTYVVGVVPAKRCLVVSCAAESQHGWYQSGLMQAGSLTHMTIGAATAIGTLRAIDRDLECLEAADPSRIAEIDGEIATDLREVYDLDITSEEYRSLYRLLREHLGITRDYKALQDKMATLYRATSTKHEVKSQRQLNWLTGAIVALTVLIVIIEVFFK